MAEQNTMPHLNNQSRLLTDKNTEYEIMFKREGGATNLDSIKSRESRTPEQNAKTYDEWVIKGTYEQDTANLGYSGPQITADTVAMVFPKNKEKIRILDMAAGTGLVAIRLRKHGFKRIDAVDPSPASKKVAMEKNVYGRYLVDFVDERRLDIETDEYDCVVSAGGFGPGLMPSIALKEFVRVVKPGGYACFSCTEYILSLSKDHKEKFEALIEEYIRQGVWEKVSRSVVQGYFDFKPGVVYVFRVLKSEVQP
ncbi:hypothetical protein SNE40_007222 [Patella caerulea]|uniref:Methyltransferase domain-containing protein n=1 Tax=Patella caerulea TaxID=87958 RepID=A0AAN8JXH8_PATCE